MLYLDKLEDKEMPEIEKGNEAVKGYVSLHQHTEFSLLDGSARIKDLVAKAKELGMTALAMTDHGNMFGAVKFYKECKKQGIKPIIGCEVYTAERNMEDKEAGVDKPIGHLILLVMNETGYKNLIKIVSEAYVKGFYYKPRTDKKTLRKYSEGLICLSGCLAGKTQRLIVQGKYDEAKKEASELKDIFGENFYLELQNHYQEEDEVCRDGLFKLSEELDIPIVATNDGHYVNAEDATAQEMLMCLQTQTNFDNPNHMKFNGPYYYLKSEEEMREILPAQAVSLTVDIAEKCNFDFEFGKYHIPAYTAPPQFKTNEDYFKHLCYTGLQEKYETVTDELKERLDYEISVIVKMGFVEYFLIVWDFINYAKKNGIAVGPGRGCAIKGTLIQTENGLIPIEEIQKGVKVYTHDGSLQKVYATHKYPLQNEILKQILCYDGSDNGNAFTTDHKIYVVKKSDVEDETLKYIETEKTPTWMPVSEINIGDYVSIPKTHENGKTTYFLKKIYELKDIKNEKFVYDISVEHNASYITDSFIAHNSAAGSVVAYALSITEVDPIKYSLFFERFLNPERVSMPDIDVDFCIRRRGDVIKYVQEKYGEDHVCQIATLGTMKSKMAVRDVARTMSVPYAEANELAKMIPDEADSIADALVQDADLKAKYDSSPTAKGVLDMAMKLENLPRHSSTHAAGVVIAPEPVDNFVPLVYSPKGIATQYTMTEIEELGLLKMDFLGLRNLTVIQDTIELVKKNHNIDIDINSLTYDDEKVYDMLAKGKTIGVFQLESKGITDFFKKLKPTCIEDVIAGVALYRPGPMDSIPRYLQNKRNPKQISYMHESLASILDVTYGCIVYQEQVMQIVQQLAGYSFARADLVRRAMSKKKADVMEKERQYFIFGKDNENGNVEIQGCVRNGIPENIARAIFDEMESFAQYAFNKSHATAYSLITYQTAWLKYYYPSEFMASLMTSESSDSEHLSLFIREARKMNATGKESRIKVLPPSVNRSAPNFTSDKDGNIYFGLAAIKGVGAKAAVEIVENKPYTNIFEVAQNDEVNAKTLESLISAGATKELGVNVNTALFNKKEILTSAKQMKKDALSNQMSLFDLGLIEEHLPELYQLEEYPHDKLLALEKEFMGTYVTGHPMNGYKLLIKEHTNMYAEDIQTREVTGSVAGMIVSTRAHYTKKGQKMMFVEAEDVNDTLFDIVVFPTTYDKYHYLLEEGAILIFTGKASEGSMIVDKIIPAGALSSMSPNTKKKPGELHIKSDKPLPEIDKAIKKITRDIKGDCLIRLYHNGGVYISNIKTRYDSLMINEMKDFFGENNVKWAN